MSFIKTKGRSYYIKNTLPVKLAHCYMKYILELLGEGQPCDSREAAISTLDAYVYHRPGQPIAAIYINSKGKTRALLAIGHAYGVGLAGSERRYTIIGDADASQSIINYNFASQIKLSRISYSRLLDDYAEHVNADGSRRFGYLGTSYDSWHSGSDPDAIPNGATVQEAFEHILKGNFGDDSTVDHLSINVSVIGDITDGTIVIPNAGEPAKTYTVVVTIDYSGTLQSASFSGTDNSSGGSGFLSQLAVNRQWSKEYIVGSDYPLSGESTTILYTASASNGSQSDTDSATVTIRREGSTPPPGGDDKTYKIYYYRIPSDGSLVVHESSDSAIGAFPTLRQQCPFSSPAGTYFVGWTQSNTGTGSIVNSLNQNMFQWSDAENAEILLLYTVFEEQSSSPKTLRVIAPTDSLPYSGERQVYHHTLIKVYADNTEMNITWSPVTGGGYTGTGDGFTVSFVGGDLPSRKDVGSDERDVKVEVNPGREEDYDEAGASATAVLNITPKPATVSALLNGESSVTLQVGSSAPSQGYAISGFVPADQSALSGLQNWQIWSPDHPDMTQNGQYILSFDPSVIPSGTADNYTIDYIDATLNIQEVQLEVTYTTYADSSGKTTTNPAQHINGDDDVVNIRFVDMSSVPSNTEGISGWWIIFANNKRAAQSDTIIGTNKTVKITHVKLWDESHSEWYTPDNESSYVTSFDTPGTSFTYQDPDGYFVIVGQQFVALKIEEQ
jgi:hypothetical protein